MLRIITFGRLAVTHPDRELGGAVLQPRRLAILSVLARAGARGMSRERLMRLLWPDDDDVKSRRALTQAIYALRRDLQCEVAIDGTHDVVLNPEFIRSDVNDFTVWIKEGRLSEAAAVYGGSFLEGFSLSGAPQFERWVDDERTALRHDYARIVERLAQQAEREGARADAVTWWRALTALDPLNAQAAVSYMKALDAVGDRVKALLHARIYESLVAQELDLPPDPVVIALASAMRAAPLAVAPVPALLESIEVPKAVAVDAQGGREYEDHRATTAPRIWFWLIQRRVRIALAATAVIAVAIAARFIWTSSQHAVDAIRVTEARRLTSEGGLELDPAISVDGNLVAYASGTEGSLRIFVRQIDGGNPIMISGKVAGDHRQPRWSPSGLQLLFQAERGIWMVPALGGAAKLVVPPPANIRIRAAFPEWSPDGREIAWMQGDTLSVRALEGGHVRIVGEIASGHSLAWSPDGEWFAVASENVAFVYNQSMNPLAPASIGNIAPGALYVVRADGNSPPLRLPLGSHLNTSPEWLGDSRRLAFVSDRDGMRDIYVLALGTDGRPAGEPVRLTTGLDPHTVSSSRDGRTMVFTQFRQRANLWYLPLTSGRISEARDAVEVTSGAQNIEAMSLSPDGTWLAYDSDRSGQQDIYKVPVDGSSEPEKLVATANYDFHPEWSPDGKFIAFYSVINDYRRGGIVSSNGGTPRYFGNSTVNVEEHSPTWGANGLYLLFHHYANDAGVFRVDRHSDSSWSAPRKLLGAGFEFPQESPDGSLMLFLTGLNDVGVMPSNGHQAAARTLLHGDGREGVVATSTRWAPDGRSIFVKGQTPTGQKGLWQLPLTDGRPVQLVRFNDAYRPSVRQEFATDGRRVYFTLVDRIADLWMLRLQ